MTLKLSRALIGKASGRVARRDGVEAVTMRSVAAALGVTPMALYRYVESSDALRRLSVDAGLQAVEDPPAEGSVAVRFRGWALGARRSFRRCPDLAEACLTDWPELREGCRIMDRLLAVAAEHTTRGAEQVVIANAVFVYVLARIATERTGSALGKQRTLPAVEAAPRQFPRLAKLQHHFATIDTDRHFALGLDALLDGLLASKE